MIRARAKGSSKYLAYKTCCLGISLGSHNHERPAYSAVVDWVTGKFDQCVIDLSDTLHAYTHMLDHDISLEEAIEHTYQEGTKWLERHQDLLDKLNMPYEIRRWDSLRLHPDFERLREEFYTVFQNNIAFRAAVSRDVRKFLERKYGSQFHIMPRHINLCISYLMNELAGHTILFRDFPCATVYPGRQAQCFEMVRNGEVPEAPFGLQNSYFTRLSLYGFDGEDVHAPDYKKAASA